MKVGDLFVGKKLIVGDPTSALTGIGRPPVNIRGTAYIEAPMIVGDDLKFPAPEATMMIGRCTNSDLPTVPGLFRIRNLVPGTETPQDVVIGDPSGPVGVTVFCGTSFFTVEASTISFVASVINQIASTVTEVEAIKSDTGAKVNAGVKVEGGVDTNLSKAINMAPMGGPTLSSFLDFVTFPAGISLTKTNAIAQKALAKNFDIKHPTKEGHRLRHSCVEAPQNDVYIRGKLKGTNIIELPNYWKDLVDLESITVHLTPIGCRQSLYYEEVEWGNKIKVLNADCGPVWCSYTVFAERKDVEKLIPEYEGETPESYPGNNDVYDISGWNK